MPYIVIDGKTKLNWLRSFPHISLQMDFRITETTQSLTGAYLVWYLMSLPLLLYWLQVLYRGLGCTQQKNWFWVMPRCGKSFQRLLACTHTHRTLCLFLVSSCHTKASSDHPQSYVSINPSWPVISFQGDGQKIIQFQGPIDLWTLSGSLQIFPIHGSWGVLIMWSEVRLRVKVRKPLNQQYSPYICFCSY